MKGSDICGKAKKEKYLRRFPFTFNWLELHKGALLDLGLKNTGGSVIFFWHSVSI